MRRCLPSQEVTTHADCVPGYTGRNFAKYLHDNNLASEVRLVDKQLPELSWLAPEFKEACSREHFIQADAAQESAYQRPPRTVPAGWGRASAMAPGTG